LLSQAATKLATAAAAMEQELPIQVETWVLSNCLDGKASGYVWGGPFTAYSDIHLMPKFFENDPIVQAGTILHESMHKYAGVSDRAYAGEGSFMTLTPEQALDNADSYSNFCERKFEHVKEKQDAEKAAADKAAQEAALSGHAAEVWAAYEAGEIVLWGRDVRDDGTPLGAYKVGGLLCSDVAVAAFVYQHFKANFPAQYAEAAEAALAGHEETPFVCKESGGYTIREDLFTMIGQYEAG
jgi:hypothetical protein